jgi:hypothetical protein
LSPTPTTHFRYDNITQECVAGERVIWTTVTWKQQFEMTLQPVKQQFKMAQAYQPIDGATGQWGLPMPPGKWLPIEIGSGFWVVVDSVASKEAVAFHVKLLIETMNESVKGLANHLEQMLCDLVLQEGQQQKTRAAVYSIYYIHIRVVLTLNFTT